MTTPLVEIDGLRVVYGNRRRRKVAVDGVSFAIYPGETVGLVGESGSGKTTIGRALLGLAPISEGNVTFAQRDITRASSSQRRLLSRDMQMVFQDPFSSLNPSRTIFQTLAEPLIAHKIGPRGAFPGRIVEILEKVGLDDSVLSKYPAAFSGGQRQRIAVARALMTGPKFVVCDEAVSALDLSVQAQTLNLLMDLQSTLSLSYLFITHDLAVVEHVSQRVIVLNQGSIVEEGEAEQVCRRPTTDYAKRLRDSVLEPVVGAGTAVP